MCRGTKHCVSFTIAPTTGPEDERSVDKMWSGYMQVADRHDAVVNDIWRDDANGVMIFVSLINTYYERPVG